MNLLIRIRLIVLLIGPEDHLMLILWHGTPGCSQLCKEWGWESILGSCLPMAPTFFCVVWGCFHETERFSFRKIGWTEKSFVSSRTWRQGWLNPNKGSHFQFDELRGGGRLEALEISQKVAFLPFNINVRLDSKSQLDPCARGGHWPWRLLLWAAKCQLPVLSRSQQRGLAWDRFTHGATEGPLESPN